MITTNEPMTAEQISNDSRFAKGGLTLEDAVDAARAGRLWAVDTQNRGADQMVEAPSETVALDLVAHFEEDDEAVRADMATRWSANRVVLVPSEVVELSTALTAEQFRATAKLASSFGHHWADVESVWDLFDGWQSSVEIADIERCAVEALDPGQVGGICAPTLDADGSVRHTTGSGRLHWRVDRAGVVTLSIWRPDAAAAYGDREVLAAVVGADGRIGHGAEVTITVGGTPDVRPLARHLAALRAALDALVGAESSWAAVLPTARDCDARLALSLEGGSLHWHLVDALAPADEGAIAPLVFPLVPCLGAAVEILRAAL